MNTESEIRRRIAAILRLGGHPMSRVRELVRLASEIKVQTQALAVARDASIRASHANASASLDRLVRGRRMLYDDVRLAAWNLLLSNAPAAVLR